MTTTSHDAAARNTALEEWLDTHHVTWTYEPALPLDQVDVNRSLANQARIGDPLIAEVVDQYTEDYRRGDRFPALLAHRTSSRAKKVVLLGGNHRYAAACKAGLATHPAYIITDAAPEVAVAAMYADNRRHGARLTLADRVAQAVHLVHLGWTQADAARELGISQPAVSQGITRLEGAARAKDLGLGVKFEHLPQGHQTRLALIASDPVFEEAVKLVADAKLTQSDTNALCQAVKNARSEAAALRVIGAERETRTADVQRASFGERTTRNTPTPYTRLRTALDTILALDPADVVAASPNADTTAVLRQKVKDTAKHLMAIDVKASNR